MALTNAYFAPETAVIDSNCIIGHGTNNWYFSHILTKSQINGHDTIGQNVMISPDVILKNNVKAPNNVSVHSGIIGEDNVFLSSSVVFTNIRHPRNAINRRDQYQTTIIKEGATVGAKSTVLRGINISEYAFMGAGSVVTKPVLYASCTVIRPGSPAGRVNTGIV